MGVWQDDFHQLSTGGVGEGLQGRTLPRRLRKGNVKFEDRFTGG